MTTMKFRTNEEFLHDALVDRDNLVRSYEAELVAQIAFWSYAGSPAPSGHRAAHDRIMYLKKQITLLTGVPR